MNALSSQLSNSEDLVIIAVPCNLFELQEPGKNHEILNGIKYVRPGNGYEPTQNFHFMAKSDVNGENELPLYTHVKALCPAPTEELGDPKNFYWSPIRRNDVSWNFEKFIISREGKPLYRFHPSVEPHQIVPFLQCALDQSSHSDSCTDKVF